EGSSSVATCQSRGLLKIEVRPCNMAPPCLILELLGHSLVKTLGGARSRGRQDVLRRPDHRACSPSSRCLPGAQEPSRSLPPDGRPIDDRDPGARSREMNRETHNDYSRTAAIPAAEKNLPTSGYCYRQPTPAQSLQAAKSC